MYGQVLPAQNVAMYFRVGRPRPYGYMQKRALVLTKARSHKKWR